MVITAKQWKMVDVISLCLAHTLHIDTAKSNPPLPKLTAETVAQTDMNVVSFLKHVNVTLTDKN